MRFSIYQRFDRADNVPDRLQFTLAFAPCVSVSSTNELSHGLIGTLIPIAPRCRKRTR